MNLKVDGSNLLKGYHELVLVFFIHHTHVVVWYFATFFILEREMARIYPPNQKTQNAKFFTF